MRNDNNRFLAQLLSRNNSLKNTHVGERCFVIGNGPSLKQEDLSLLRNEFVFTVNRGNLIDGFDKLNTNAHLWVDAAWFGLRNDVKLDVNTILSYYNQIAKSRPIFFAIVQGYNFVKQHRLDEKLDVYYLCQGYPDIASQPLYIDINAPISCFRTVTQYAVCIAIFMGFKEIYLLGCDATNILGVIDPLIGKTNTSHAYDEEKDTSYTQYYAGKNQVGRKEFEYSDITTAFLEEYNLQVGYDKLGYICWNMMNIKLINCSAQTIVQAIPRMNLSDVLNKSQSTIQL